jgi:hypothetical protein
MIDPPFRRCPQLLLALGLAPLALSAQPKPDETVKLPPYNVVEPPVQESKFHALFEGLNHRFDGPFPELRSGPMVEAILWRHRFLEEHPNEDAIIVTTGDGGRIISATTVYTLGGALYASSNALGEHKPFKGLKAGELRQPGAVEKFRATILSWRRQLSEGWDSREAPYEGRDTTLDAQKTDLTMKQNGGAMALTRNAVGGFAGIDTDDGGISDMGPPTLNSALVKAEDTGNYDVLMEMSGPASSVHLASGASPGARIAANMLDAGMDQANLDFKSAQVQAFFEPSGEVLSWTYGVLRNPRHAGLIPVALDEVTFPTKAGKPATFRALVFDWEGRQYVYEPNTGTFAWDLPRNPLTAQPFLCQHGDAGRLLESVYFCATYPRAHPGEQAVLIPGMPAAVAYTAGGHVALFGLALAPFQLPPRFGPALLGDAKALTVLRDRVAAEMARRRADPNAKAVPSGLPADQMGDSEGLQLRRAYLAFHDAGIPSALDESASPVLSFTWNHMGYACGTDGQVHTR